MDALPSRLLDALASDRLLAAEHDIAFTVVGRRTTGPSRTADGPPIGPPTEHGIFADPADAVLLARRLVEQDITVLADGHGAYWASGAPDEVDSALLQIVSETSGSGRRRPSASTSGIIGGT